jgi:hypothetical protein
MRILTGESRQLVFDKSESKKEAEKLLSVLEKYEELVQQEMKKRKIDLTQENIKEYHRRMTGFFECYHMSEQMSGMMTVHNRLYMISALLLGMTAMTGKPINRVSSILEAIINEFSD